MAAIDDPVAESIWKADEARQKAAQEKGAAYLEKVFNNPEAQADLAKWLHPDDPVARLKAFKEGMGRS